MTALEGIIEETEKEKKEEQKTHTIKKFFMEYSPYGGLWYAHNLFSNPFPAAYTARGKEADNMIKQIVSFPRPDINSSFEKLLRATKELIDLLNQMKNILIDNPFDIMCGIYQSNGIVCKNMKGIFAYEILGMVVPLGFSAKLKNVRKDDKS